MLGRGSDEPPGGPLGICFSKFLLQQCNVFATNCWVLELPLLQSDSGAVFKVFLGKSKLYYYMHHKQ